MCLRQLLTAFAAVAVVSFTCLASASAAQTVTVNVKKVSDGDTITGLTAQGVKLKVRLYGIDAPETSHPNKLGQPWGDEARSALDGKVMGKTVTLDVKAVDRYKRIVAIVNIGDRDINREMVQDGHAWAYRQHLDRPYASAYLSAEEQARSARRGIWQHGNPQPPWEFRKRFR